MCLLGELFFGPLLVQSHLPNLLLSSHFHFQSFFLKLLWGLQPNLTGKILRGLRYTFWGNCTLAHVWCTHIGLNYFMLTLVLLELFFKNNTLLDHKCAFREICLTHDLCNSNPLSFGHVVILTFGCLNFRNVEYTPNILFDNLFGWSYGSEI